MNKNKIFTFIFDTTTKSGRMIDIFISIVIVVSIFSVMLESVPIYEEKYGRFFVILEWIITFLFTVEYLSRVYLEKMPANYIFSLFGLIDLLTIIPTYLSIFVDGTQGFMVIRALRLLRVFRILKLNKNSNKGKVILDGIKASKDKIIIFFYGLAMLITIIGTLLYLIEGKTSGFTSIPASIYWTISQLTVMGADNISPQTSAGLAVESFVKIMAHIVIAIPTGIVTATILNTIRSSTNPLICPHCDKSQHDSDARFCKECGNTLIDSVNIDIEEMVARDRTKPPTQQ